MLVVEFSWTSFEVKMGLISRNLETWEMRYFMKKWA
jgi:hypothetical protein